MAVMPPILYPSSLFGSALQNSLGLVATGLSRPIPQQRIAYLAAEGSRRFPRAKGPNVPILGRDLQDTAALTEGSDRIGL